MKRKTFKFVDPLTGVEIVAEITTASLFFLERNRPMACGSKKHNMWAVLNITQWGFDCQTDTVVYGCKRCKKCWAFKLETIEEIAAGTDRSETDVLGGLNDIEQVAQETDIQPMDER